MSTILTPVRRAVAVTPTDATSIPGTDALYVGGAGNVSVVMDGATVLFTAVPVGTVLPVRVDGVNATGTTATAILALYR